MRFDETIRSYEFIKNEDKSCVYTKISGSAITFVVLYVNDILLIGNDVGMLSSGKAWMPKNFFMKDWERQLTYWEYVSIEIDERSCSDCLNRCT